MTEVATWMKSNCLKLNSDKTEVVIFGKTTSLWDSTWWLADLGPTQTPTAKGRYLGLMLDEKHDSPGQLCDLHLLPLPEDAAKNLKMATRKQSFRHSLVADLTTEMPYVLESPNSS